MTLHKWFEPNRSADCPHDAPETDCTSTGSVCLPDTGITRSGEEADILYLEALMRIEGLGVRGLLKLLREAGSPESLWNAPDAFLRARLDETRRLEFLARREAGTDFEWLEQHREAGVQIIPLTAPQYPALLKEIHDPPPLLFVRGDIRALTGKTIAMVGTRNASEYGCRVVEKLCRDLAPCRPVIVSGFAAGIDTAAHRAALQYGLPTVAVFGCGLDIIYPVSNRGLGREIIDSSGALVSEYPLGRQPDRHTFPRRNRIIVGLSYGIAVIEGDIKSGAMITARIAAEEGRSVFAAPGNIFSPGSLGPLHLLKSGAIPLTCGEDILTDLKWLPANPAASAPESSPVIPDTLGEAEQRVLTAIAFDPTPIENLPETTGLPSAKINEALTLLELDGLIVLLPGAKACRR